MSEVDFDTLFQDYTKKLDKLNTKFYVAWDKLEKNCKHEKTHWMQELAKDGSFKEGLYKRCFVCGATVENLDCEGLVEQALKAFDDFVENNKSASNNPKNMEKKENAES